MLQSLANRIVQEMEAGYDKIASHFSDTRHDPWPEFESLIPYCTPDTQLLDVGCGNGRLAQSILAVHYTGLDLSSQLLEIARQRFPQYQFVHGSVLQLPFQDQTFDVVACVATLQHIPSVAYRQQALSELTRVLRPGGTLFMLNWNLAEQPQYQQYLASETAGYDPGDYLIPWKNEQGELQTNRYYHGFSIAELAELARKAELRIENNELGEVQRNILTILTKSQN